MTERTHIDLAYSKEEHRTATVRSYGAAAGGFGALRAVVTEAWRHTGLIRAANILAKLNQVGGFDCSSCAWPDPPQSERTPFEFCENGAKATLWDNTRKAVTPALLSTHTVTELRTESDYELESYGRITSPLRYDAETDRYLPITWSRAISEIGDYLSALKDADRATFYTSGRTSNEAAFLYQLFVRTLGTNNLPDCSNMCHESSGTGLGRTIGIGKGTVSLQDFDLADAIFVIGQNPGTNHPRMLTTLEAAAKRGAQIVSVNPLLERGLQRFGHPQNPLAILGQSQDISTHYVQVRINGDMAFLQGIAKWLFKLDRETPCLDHDFIANHTHGFDEYRAHIESIPWQNLEQNSGITRERMREIARVYAEAKSSIICWAMGLTQHRNGVGNITEVVNLLLMKGNLGRPGAGACPVRGHSNVQGDRTMGIYERPSSDFLNSLEGRYQFEAPQAHGYDTVGAIEALQGGKTDFFMSMGGNFVAATPDTAAVAEGMLRTQMTVSVATRLNRTHVYPGQRSFILPCLVRSEEDIRASGPQFVTCENSMSIVSRSQGKRPPPDLSLRSEVAIICDLARASLSQNPKLQWDKWRENYDLIRDEIESVIPGFEDYNLRVRQPNGFVLPNGVRNRQWHTRTGKAHFSCHTSPAWSLEDNELLLGTLRSHDQFNTTIYGHDDRYRGIFGGRRVLMISAADLKKHQLKAGDLVDITSHYNRKQRTVYEFRTVQTDLPQGSVMAYFPETNPLIPYDSYALESRTPTSKSIVVTLARSRRKD